MDIDKSIYITPQVKVVEINSQQVICGSNSTEGFGLSGFGLGDNAWE